MLGFNFQWIQVVYFVGRNSIFFGCVSISVDWILLLTVKCCKVKVIFYLRVLVFTRNSKTPLQNSLLCKYCINYLSTVIPKFSFSGSRQYHDRQSIRMIMRGNKVRYGIQQSLSPYLCREKNCTNQEMDRVKRIWYLLPMRAAKVQASLRIRAVLPEPSLLAHTSTESRGTSDRKPDPWPLWMAGHAQLKFFMTECLKTQICLMWPK